MEKPAQEIEGVIRGLTQSDPTAQHETLVKYFALDASFTHPICRTGSNANSRALIWMIYRWYKIMSPVIELEVNSIGASGAPPSPAWPGALDR